MVGFFFIRVVKKSNSYSALRAFNRPWLCFHLRRVFYLNSFAKTTKRLLLFIPETEDKIYWRIYCIDYNWTWYKKIHRNL